MSHKIIITVEFEYDELTKRRVSRAVQSAARAVTENLPEGPIKGRIAIEGSINRQVSYTVEFKQQISNPPPSA